MIFQSVCSELHFEKSLNIAKKALFILPNPMQAIHPFLHGTSKSQNPGYVENITISNVCLGGCIISALHCPDKMNLFPYFSSLRLNPSRSHRTERRGLCLMKSSSKMLQYLPYFIYTKTQSWFFHLSFCAALFFPLMNAKVYVEMDQAIH